MYQLATLIAAATVLSSPNANRPASCAVENRPAAIVQLVAPEYSEIAASTSLTGRTVVEVDLTESGRVRSSSVHVSSGSRILDSAALRAANAMTYAPEIRECASVAGSYAVDVDFDGN